MPAPQSWVLRACRLGEDWLTRRRLSSWVAAVLLLAAYAVWWFVQPRGSFEFGYAPFTVEPLPYAPMRGFTYEQLWNHIARFVLLTPAVILIGGQVVAARRLSLDSSGADWSRYAVLGSVAACAGLIFFVFRGRAFCEDELVYAMQARFLSEGRIADSRLGFTPPEPFSIPTRVGYTGKYLPGEPLVQILGVMAGYPALLHIALLFVTLVLWRKIVSARSNERFAGRAVAALALSPMLVFTSATGLSQVSALFGIVLLGYGLARCEGGATRSGAVLSALGGGFTFFCRPQAAVPAGLILVPLVVIALVRKRCFLGMSLLLLLGGMFAGGLLLYNYQLSGDPFTLPWYLQCASEHFGFGQVWKTSKYLHTPWTMLQNLVVVAVRLNAWWLGLPAGLFVIVAWFAMRKRSHGQGRWLWVGLAVIAFEALYYSPGISDTGAIYHFELLLPGSVIAATVVERIVEKWGRAGVLALTVVMAIGAGSFFIEQLLRINRMMSTLHGASDWAIAAVQAPAILLHEHWGPESLNVGWLDSDSFPRRYRGTNDEIVTFPRVPERLLSRLREAYPNRNCYYYHRRNEDEHPELLRCEDAQLYLSRAFLNRREERRALWVVPTAYKKSDYDPFAARAALRMRNAQGLAVSSCCALDELEEFGESIEPETRQSCIIDGPSTADVRKRAR